VVAAGVYLIASAFWNRLPMLREWPPGEEISKPHIPTSRASKLACGLCVGSFGLSFLIWLYLPWRMYQRWICLFALSVVAVFVTIYLDWLWAPGGDRTTFRGRYIGEWANFWTFWNNPAYSRRTKILGTITSIAMAGLTIWFVVAWTSRPGIVFEICFWCVLTLGFVTAYSARFIDKND
jgi:hypothetical protein